MNKKLTLKDLGAEKCINLLQPMKCECGCGSYANMIIKDEEDYNVFTVAGSLLSETDCEHAWIFILEDWIVSGAFTTEEGIQYFSTAETRKPFVNLEEQVEFVKGLIEDIQPHCIGVLQQTENGTFRVVTDKIYDRR
jgi:hypothetical protein